MTPGAFANIVRDIKKHAEGDGFEVDVLFMHRSARLRKCLVLEVGEQYVVLGRTDEGPIYLSYAAIAGVQLCS